MFRSELTLTLRGIVLVAALTLSPQGEALAEQNPYSAKYVMPGCRDYVSLTTFKQGWCGGLITGLAQMHRRCMPPQLTQRQLASAIVQYVDAQPARMHEDFRILAAEACRQTGETPNLAARVQQAAEPGTVVIADSTRRLVGDLFELVGLGALQLKGFAEPVLAWRVIGEGSAEVRGIARGSGHTARRSRRRTRSDAVALAASGRRSRAGRSDFRRARDRKIAASACSARAPGVRASRVP